MPLYTFTCPHHGSQLVQFSLGEYRGEAECRCGTLMQRDLAADLGTITANTFGCADHSHIPEGSRVNPHHGRVSRETAERLEKAYGRHLHDQRKSAKRSGRLRKTHSVPAEAYFGKIKQTGDREYWNDPTNLSHHTDFKI